MMLSFRQVLKPQMVNLDTENKILIDTGQSPLDETADDEPPDPNKRENDAKKTAASIVKIAERQAEEILNNSRIAAAEERESTRKSAQAEATRALTEARDTGYKDGMATATAEGDKIKAEAAQILEAAKAERIAMQESLEPEIVSMIISITEKLLGNMSEVNPKVIINLIRQGFTAATLSGNVTVYVSAADYDAVVENKNDLLALTDGSVKLEITKDLSLSPMDCVIETPFGDIDCSLGQQFETLRANLIYILNNR